MCLHHSDEIAASLTQVLEGMLKRVGLVIIADLNFSEWDKPQRIGMDEVREEITDGDMPMASYVLLHPEAKLTEPERAQLIEGLRATFAQDPPTVAPRPRRR